MIFFPYIISWCIGYFTINILVTTVNNKTPSCITPLLHYTLAFGLGLGISSILTFFSFLLCNGFHPIVIIGFNSATLIGLIWANVTLKLSLFPKIKLTPFDFILILVCPIILYIIYFLAGQHPFGEWDAWALWNMKTKFLIFSANSPNSWTAIFTQVHWHSQPDYPLLLPFVNVWVAVFTHEYSPKIPFITAILWTFSCGVLLYAGLQTFIKPYIAALAALILLIHPFYIFLGTAQYSDILLAYYLLASLIMLLLLTRDNTQPQSLPALAAIAGSLFGLMTFTKNEGIVFALLLSIGTTIYLAFSKQHKSQYWRILQHLLFGLLATALSTIIFKIFLAPPNRDILSDLSSTSGRFFNWHGISILAFYIKREIFHQRWVSVWLLTLFLFITRFRKFFYKECKILFLFFTFYFLIVIFIYLTTSNFDLAWRLKSTLQRIYFYMFPSILFCCFYSYWRGIDTKS